MEHSYANCLMFLMANYDTFGSSWLVLTIDFSLHCGHAFLLFAGVVSLVGSQVLWMLPCLVLDIFVFL